MTTPDPWLGSVSLRSNICTRHLSAETDKDGNCLGCSVEKERENNSWWVESAHYTEPVFGQEDESISEIANRLFRREMDRWHEAHKRGQLKAWKRRMGK